MTLMSYSTWKNCSDKPNTVQFNSGKTQNSITPPWGWDQFKQRQHCVVRQSGSTPPPSPHIYSYLMHLELLNLSS